MKQFVTCEGPAAVLMEDNIDTDVIVRIERVAHGKRGEFAPWAFEALRYAPDGSENPRFVLNREPFRKAQILLTGANFGCGSSREMAVWALDDFGIRCVIAESFGDIFFGNCLQIGVLPITLARPEIERLARIAVAGHPIRVDLRAMRISAMGTTTVAFEMAASIRTLFLEGLDSVDETLRLRAEIDRFQEEDRRRRPWIYGPPRRQPMNAVVSIARQLRRSR